MKKSNVISYASLVEQSQALPAYLHVSKAIAMPHVTLKMKVDIQSQKQLINLFEFSFSDSVAEDYTQETIALAREQVKACELELERTLALFN